MLAGIPGFAQNMAQPGDSAAMAGQKDLIDVYHKLFKKSAPPRSEGKFHNAPFPAIGYTLQTGVAAVLSDNLAFYTGNPQQSKVSEVSTSITYSQYNQIILPVLADIWTKGNKYNIIADWRFMKYPSTTFGLGGHSQYSNGYTINFSYIKLHTSVLRYIIKNLYAGLGYYIDYIWNIREVNPPPGVITSFQRYGLSSTESANGPVVRVLFDSRINPLNSFNGFYGSVVYHPSMVSLGSSSNWTSIQVDLRKYFKLNNSGRNILALWSFNWLTYGNKPPYLLLPSTGWDDQFNTGRGYIQGRFRGANMTYLEIEDRFAISRNGLIGGVVFANVQSFKKNQASHYHDFDPGYGAGLRFKVNKHSGANICIDYGFGLNGSQGIAVNLGEVF